MLHPYLLYIVLLRADANTVGNPRRYGAEDACADASVFPLQMAQVN